MSNKRIKIYSGSLKAPLLRYVTGIELIFNPFSPVKTRHFHDRMFELANKYNKNKVQEEYYFTHYIIQNRDLNKKNYCKVCFLEGNNLEFDFTDAEWDDFISMIKSLNEVFENHRNIKGKDDEYEDDV